MHQDNCNVINPTIAQRFVPPVIGTLPIYQVLVLNLTDEMLCDLTPSAPAPAGGAGSLLFTALAAYDQRGGGAETQNRGDKQGLHLTHRNKHSFVAQEMLVLLAQLAHNLLVWTRNDLARADDHFTHYGIMRMVRDVLQIPGCVQLDEQGRVIQITLQETHPLAAKVQMILVDAPGTDEM
jgi:hypothetical protein